MKLEDDLKALTDALNEKRTFNASGYLKKFLGFIGTEDLSTVNRNILLDYLHNTKHPNFLSALSFEERYKWADSTFKVIEAAEYNLLDLFEYTVKKNKEKALFISTGSQRNDYTYKYVYNNVKQLSASIFKTCSKPVAAIFAENSFESAITDIACLCFDILITPLNVHFTEESLDFIFRKTNINIIFTDSLKRLEILKRLKQNGYDFVIIYYGDSTDISADASIILFRDLTSGITLSESDVILAQREKIPFKQTATTMFTSGTTGLPKGVEFSIYNLITKRYARGAVLPFVGNDEILLCYLPLYHTFGRFLEMLGMIYWEGTYVFAYKNDANTLMKQMKEINPTGFISVPLRWKEIFDRINTEIHPVERTRNSKLKSLKKYTGEKLKWGLSAAGYLEPKVFKFFNSLGVTLCSGFGMTEATGGVSMTPIDQYIPDSVGIPLPGINIKFSPEGELLISGPYIGKYLDDMQSTTEDKWISTGDLFIQDNDHHLYIIDRVKEIYKNSKGQTIAPAAIEKKFENVPGIKQVFLAGDMKPFNALLIVPNHSDSFVTKALLENKLKDYYASLISNVNKTLHPYERILKFTILDRAFAAEKGELTAKGTYKRKVIQKNFDAEISDFYRKSSVEYSFKGFTLIIPFWVLKDLGLSQEELFFSDDALYNKDKDIYLTIKSIPSIEYIDNRFDKDFKSDLFMIGSFIYIIENKTIDLGKFILQPFLWLGNIELINFIDCKEEWDIGHSSVSTQLFVEKHTFNCINTPIKLNDHCFNTSLKTLNCAIIKAIFGKSSDAANNLKILEKYLIKAEPNIVNVVCRRLETFAFHHDFNIRSTAYKILLLNQPYVDYNKYLPSFIHSGLPFLNKSVIEEIIFSSFNDINLSALRKRLEAYRNGIKWPVSAEYAKQFNKIFDLLISFVHHNLSAYSQVRAELISWILYNKDKNISANAQKLFDKLSRYFERQLKLTLFEQNKVNWYSRLVFQEQISGSEGDNLKKLFAGTNFLKEAFFLIFGIESFNLKDVKVNGIFISRISASNNKNLYRISVNTITKQHYDLILFSKPNLNTEKTKETIYLMIKIADNTSGDDILPKLGNFRSKRSVITLAYINELTLWEKIRQTTSALENIKIEDEILRCEILFKRAMSTFFIFLKKAAFEVIPGNISPFNVFVTEPFYKEGKGILSISGWKKFKNLKQLFFPMYMNFFFETTAHYPWLMEILDINWIFDSCLEGLGVSAGLEVLNKLKDELKLDNSFESERLYPVLLAYLDKKDFTYYKSTKILGPMGEYNLWLKDNTNALKTDKKEYLLNIYKLYLIEGMPDISRFIFLYEAYFKYLSKEINNHFIKLLDSFYYYPSQNLKNKVELKEIQDLLTDNDDYALFNKMLFPDMGEMQHFEVVTAQNRPNEKSLILKTMVQDRYRNNYIIRPTITPYEIGTLQRLFVIDDYPIKFEPDLQYLVIMDTDEEHILGGISYKEKYPQVVHIYGIMISRDFRDRNLGKALMNDFFSRLRSENVNTVTSYIILKKFFESFGFRTDSRWGGLVKYLYSQPAAGGQASQQ